LTDIFDKKEMAQIAQLPSKQVLLAMVAGGLYQPLQQLALGLNMIANGEGTNKATEVAA
jgi:ribosomal protein L10